MKAWQIEQHGGPEVMKLVEVPLPEPKAGWVRVKVEAGGLNYSDIAIRRGGYGGNMPMPLLLGREFVGTIDALGEGVDNWQPGQRVVGTVSPGGAFAEFLCLPAKVLMPCPEGLSAPVAASLQIQGITAVHIIEDLAALQEGETVLIHAAAGGVGTLAIQIAKAKGAQVIGTTSSDEKCQVVEKMGARAVNYSREDWVERVLEATGGKGADVILESVGGEICERSFREALAIFGRMVIFGSASGKAVNFSTWEILASNKTLMGYYLGSYFPAHLDRVGPAVQKLVGWITAGTVKPVIGHTFPLDKVGEAYALMEGRKNVGKVIIAP